MFMRCRKVSQWQPAASCALKRNALGRGSQGSAVQRPAREMRGFLRHAAKNKSTARAESLRGYLPGVFRTETFWGLRRFEVVVRATRSAWSRSPIFPGPPAGGVDQGWSARGPRARTPCAALPQLASSQRTRAPVNPFCRRLLPIVPVWRGRRVMPRTKTARRRNTRMPEAWHRFQRSSSYGIRGAAAMFGGANRCPGASGRTAVLVTSTARSGAHRVWRRS